MYKIDENGTPKEVQGDKRIGILNSDTNESLNGTAFKQKVSKDLILYGQSIVMVDRNGNDVDNLYPLNTSDLQIDIYTSNGYQYNPIYRYYPSNQSYILNSDNVLSIMKDTDDGISGKGVLKTGADILQLALTQYKYELNLLNNSALPSGVLQFPQKMNKEVLRKTRENFAEAYNGYNKAGGVVVLENGGEYRPLQIDPDKLQLDSSKADMLGQIARLFNLPETLINAQANKYNSNEQNNLQFFQFALKPILDALTSAFNKNLLLESEKKDGYYFDFNTDSIFMNTLEEKSKSYTQLFNNGIMTFDETRNKLGLSSSKDGDDFIKFSLGNVLLDQKTGNATVFNTMDNSKGQDNNNQDGDTSDLSKPDTSKQPSNKSAEKSAKNSKKTSK